jgi:hypothetical protein
VAWGETNMAAWGDGDIDIPSGLGGVVAIHKYGAFLGDVPPHVLGLPTQRSAYVGTSVAFYSPVHGSRPMSYQWQRDGVDIPGATNAMFTITVATPGDAGAYTCTVSNAWGVAVSPPITLTVEDAAPSVWTAPADQVAFSGQDLALTVDAAGSPPMSYQWAFEGVAIPGATNATLSLTDVGYDATGRYTVTVSNRLGSVLSPAARVTVSPVAVWGDRSPDHGEFRIPAEATNVVAIAAAVWHSLALRADGTVLGWGMYETDAPENGHFPIPVPSGLDKVVAVAAGEAHGVALRDDATVVAWGNNRHGQTNVPPGLSRVVAVAAGSTFSLALTSDGTLVGWGEYFSHDSGSVGWVRLPGSALLTDIVAMAADGGLAVRADGTVTGWGPLSWQTEWQKTPGLTNVVSISSCENHHVALRADGTVVTWGWYMPPNSDVASGLTGIVAVSAGSGHDLALKADGTVVQWGREGVDEPAVRGRLRNVVAIAAGDDHNLALLGDGPLFISTQPVGRFAVAGEEVVLRTAARGQGPLHYQWLHKGIALPGETNATLSVPVLQPGDGGEYRVVVSNAVGSITSLPADVVVADPALITRHPEDQALPVGAVATFQVETAGPGPLSYQWMKDGVTVADGAGVSGALTSSLMISDVQTEDWGRYSVLVRSPGRFAISSSASLTLGPRGRVG